MLTSTQGFVFRTTAWSETSVIAKVFTLEGGLQSYMVKGVRSKGCKQNKQNLLQPLSYVDITYYKNSKRELQYVKELKPAKQWCTIPFDFRKTAIVFFMTELLYKTVREEEVNPFLFRHIEQELERLDEQEDSLAHFPITFMLSTASLLGIEPLNNYDHSCRCVFNLKEGCYVTNMECYKGREENLLSEEMSGVLYQYLSEDKDCMTATLSQRRQLLKSLLEYYKIHFDGLSNFQSHIVLHEVL
jgi:DNA repair protein RecO (recombination protein O)